MVWFLCGFGVFKLEQERTLTVTLEGALNRYTSEMPGERLKQDIPQCHLEA